MSGKKLDSIKSEKYFRVWDLVVYGVLALVIAALFLAVFLSRDDSPAGGIKISSYGTAVCVYDYQADKFTVFDGEIMEIESQSEEEVRLIFHAERGGYNKIVIDKINKSVRVSDADCSLHRDCVFTPAITDNGSAISCPPHNMKIEPVTKSYHEDGDLEIG